MKNYSSIEEIKHSTGNSFEKSLTTNRIMKKILLIFFAFLCVTTTSAYTERNLLQKQADINQLKEALILNQEWVTYPDYTDRSGWDTFLGIFKDEYIRQGEKLLDYQWPIIKATDYLAYERSGNRIIMENPYMASCDALAALLMAELAEGKGRFLDQLINGTFHFCEMTTWALSAHVVLQRSHRSLPSYDNPVFDLFAGDLGSLLSWTYYFMKDSFNEVDPEISRRLRHELQVRILDTFLNDNSFWWMARNYKKGSGLNNWNPWCNSNALMCFMLLENNRDTLAKAVYMSMESVDKYLNYIKSDGACEEGPHYWSHAPGKTFDYLDLLFTLTKGQVDIFQDPFIRRTGEYISHSYVGDNWVVNFADASAKCDASPHLIFRFGKSVNSKEMKGLAATIRTSTSTCPNGRDIFRTLSALSIDKELSLTVPEHKHGLFTWYPETEFCYLTTSDNLFLATKGGHNNESHNHNDVGSFSLWIDNTPVLIDAGVEVYSGKTFSSERYSIWTMQSNYHNLPMINGVSEKAGQNFRATDVKASKGRFSANIATAYPAEAKVKSWVRSYNMKGNLLQVGDAFELAETIAPNEINFMTWGQIHTSAKGNVTIEVNNVKASLKYDANKFDLTIEPIELTDPNLLNVWGNTIYRLSFKAKRLSKTDNYSFTIKKL